MTFHVVKGSRMRLWDGVQVSGLADLLNERSRWYWHLHATFDGTQLC